MWVEEDEHEEQELVGANRVLFVPSLEVGTEDEHGERIAESPP